MARIYRMIFIEVAFYPVDPRHLVILSKNLTSFHIEAVGI